MNDVTVCPSILIRKEIKNILTELRTVGTTVETVDIPRISSIAVKSHQIPATILYDFEIFVDKIW